MGFLDKLFNKGSSKGPSQDELLQTIIKGQERRNALFNGQRPDDEHFGYSISNPIGTSTIPSSRKYLSRLITCDGEKLYWQRAGAYDIDLHGVQGVMVDVYKLYLHGRHYKDIFVCPYMHDSSYTPKGLALAKEDYAGSTGDIECEAEAHGLRPAQFLAMQALEYENIQIKKQHEQAKIKKAQEFMASLEQKAALVRETYPDFDLKAELENTLFSSLTSSNADIKTVYEYVHRDEFFVPTQSASPVSTIETPPSFDSYYSLLKELDSSDEKAHQTGTAKPSDPYYEAIKKLEIENARLMAQRKDEKHKNWAKQAVEVKQRYPSFNLEEDYINPVFVSVLGCSNMLTAYEIVHFYELFAPKASAPEENHDSSTEHEAVLFCRKCGTKLLSDSNFCFSCGEKVVRFVP